MTTGVVRTPLSRERVLAAAMALADAEGLSALTMRRLAADVGAHHFDLAGVAAGLDLKAQWLDGLADGLRAPDGPRRSVEGREEAVAHRLDLNAAKAGEERANLWPSADQRPQITSPAGRASSGDPPALSRRAPALALAQALPLEALDVRTL